MRRKTLAMYEAVSAGFQRRRLSRRSAIVSAIVALESFIFGSAYDVTAPADIFDSGTMAEATPTSRPPSAAWPSKGHEKPADVAFSLGLEALIGGLGATAALIPFLTPPIPHAARGD